MSRRLATLLAATTLALLTTLGLAGPAAAVTTAEKLAVLANWTQTSATSYQAWSSARLDQEAWAAYQFDWSTDYCTASPDKPLGFDFRLSCHRHDFGYRNYQAAGQFSANRARVDSAFHEDLKRVCAQHHAFVRPACLSLAWTYYQAVRAFGAPIVDQIDLDRAAVLKTNGERLAATGAR